MNSGPATEARIDSSSRGHGAYAAVIGCYVVAPFPATSVVKLELTRVVDDQVKVIDAASGPIRS